MNERQLTLEDYILAINALEAEIAQPEGIASDKRWEQAEWVWNALQQPGMSTRKLAGQWKKPGGGTYSDTHVLFTARTWEKRAYLVSSWYEAFNSPEVRRRQRDGNGETPPLPECFRLSLHPFRCQLRPVRELA